MKNVRNIFYVVTIALFSLLIYWSVSKGAGLEAGKEIVRPNGDASQWDTFIHSLQDNLHHPLGLLLVQIITIIIAARFMGWLCTKIGQPTVIGEMLAGILLGPSLLGQVAPQVSEVLFPITSLGNLQMLSQIGLIFFMFIVGMELDLKVLRNKANDAVVISHASIIMPFALGIGLAYFVYEQFAPEGTQFLSFALFIGIAMSITAFPVLARIVQERGIHKTRLGTIVITCAAADDITAWCLLAAVIAIVKAGSMMSALYIMALAAIYVVVMIRIVRPFLHRIGALITAKGIVSKPYVAIFFLTLLLSAVATELIGIHALFGAFMAGAIMPENNKFRAMFIEKIEDVALIVLLPLFFVFTGLRTQIGLLNDWELWKYTLLIIVVAVAGKFIGSMVAARVVGQSWRDSLMIGALMNTRGLMELVVLNIGYDLGVLSPQIFAMMVIMALVTTFMTGPTLSLIGRFFKKDKTDEETNPEHNKSRVLYAFDEPEAGRQLKIGAAIFNGAETQYTAAHFAATEDLHLYDIGAYENKVFQPAMQVAKGGDLSLKTHFASTRDIDAALIEKTHKGKYDILLMECSQSIYDGSALGKILGFTSRIINLDKLYRSISRKPDVASWNVIDESIAAVADRLHIDFGILVPKKMAEINNVLIPFGGIGDIFLFQYMKNLVLSDKMSITIAATDANAIQSLENLISSKGWANIADKVTIVNIKTISRKEKTAVDLIIASLATWVGLVRANKGWASVESSSLIISKSYEKRSEEPVN
ncbi:MAG: cation/H(+) antiporter [Sphingobacteriales bacterium]|nr:MAG: cation/H(+) antiporter [Sphingobacteriales bacterium]